MRSVECSVKHNPRVECLAASMKIHATGGQFCAKPASGLYYSTAPATSPGPLSPAPIRPVGEVAQRVLPSHRARNPATSRSTAECAGAAPVSRIRSEAGAHLPSARWNLCSSCAPDGSRGFMASNSSSAGSDVRHPEWRRSRGPDLRKAPRPLPASPRSGSSCGRNVGASPLCRRESPPLPAPIIAHPGVKLVRETLLGGRFADALPRISGRVAHIASQHPRVAAIVLEPLRQPVLPALPAHLNPL